MPYNMTMEINTKRAFTLLLASLLSGCYFVIDDGGYDSYDSYDSYYSYDTHYGSVPWIDTGSTYWYCEEYREYGEWNQYYEFYTIAGDDDVGYGGRFDGADLGDADLPVRQDFQEEALELLVGAVELVDEEHRRALARDRFQQRALEEKGLAEDGGLARCQRALVGFLQPDLQQLALVVPLVEGGAGVEAVVTLKSDEVRCQDASHDLGDLGFADAGWAFDQEGRVEDAGEVNRRGDGRVGDVVKLSELALYPGSVGYSH